MTEYCEGKYALESECPICEKTYLVQLEDGTRVYQNNNLGWCSKCFNKLKKLLQEDTE